MQCKHAHKVAITKTSDPTAESFMGCKRAPWIRVNIKIIQVYFHSNVANAGSDRGGAAGGVASGKACKTQLRAFSLFRLFSSSFLLCVLFRMGDWWMVSFRQHRCVDTLFPSELRTVVINQHSQSIKALWERVCWDLGAEAHTQLSPNSPPLKGRLC